MSLSEAIKVALSAASTPSLPTQISQFNKFTWNWNSADFLLDRCKFCCNSLTPTLTSIKTETGWTKWTSGKVVTFRWTRLQDRRLKKAWRSAWADAGLASTRSTPEIRNTCHRIGHSLGLTENQEINLDTVRRSPVVCHILESSHDHKLKIRLIWNLR